MWAIKVDNKIYRWENGKHHDFLQFLPDYFTRILKKTITKDDIEAYWSDERNEFDHDGTGEIKNLQSGIFLESRGDDGKLQKKTKLKKMPAWPYEEVEYEREIQVPEKDKDTGLVLKDHRGNALYVKEKRKVLDSEGNPVIIKKHVANNGID